MLGCRLRPGTPPGSSPPPPVTMARLLALKFGVFSGPPEGGSGPTPTSARDHHLYASIRVPLYCFFLLLFPYVITTFRSMVIEYVETCIFHEINNVLYISLRRIARQYLNVSNCHPCY